MCTRKVLIQMHLKGLNMQGFKSFADKIELTFSDGITAIVGPNGSGKSNISDAVRWVLGEQSAKMLRGSKMEDVIFNGTQTRNRLGFAEVTLKLDNRDRHFNIDFDDVNVTRKVFASGESQYFINDAPCRLKDIHEIFMDTGLGRDGYSMIGQGKIDEILSSKSEDRRQIFEEAAGISKYRYRKEEAERRLKHTDENLDRVADIIGELEVQIEPLEQQAEKAKKYLNLRDKLKIYDVNSALFKVEKSRKESGVLDEKLNAVSAQLAQVERELSQAEGAQEEVYQLFESFAQNITEQETALKSAEESVTLGQREMDVLKSTIEGNLRLVERIEKEIIDLDSEKKNLEESLEQEEKRSKSLSEEMAALREEIINLQNQLSDFDDNNDTQNDRIEELKREITAAFERVSEQKIALANLDLLEKSIDDRVFDLKKILKERETELKEQENKSGSLSTEHERKTDLLAQLEEKLAQFKAQEDAIQEKLSQKENEINGLTLSVNQKKTRLHLLSEMEQNFEGYYKSVKEIMKQHQSGMLQKSEIYGPVSKLISVDKPYAEAIGSALGGALQNVVVATEEDAKTAINCLKQLKAGRATFMPISAVSGGLMDTDKVSREIGFVGVASELVSCDTAYSGIVQNLLGKTLVFETVDQAIAVSRKYKQSLRIVTLEGEIFYPGGSMAGGSQQKGSQLLGREQEIKELNQDIVRLEKQAEALLKEKNRLEAQILDLTEEQSETAAVYAENKEVLLLLIRDREHHDVLLSSLKAAITELEQNILDTQKEAENFLSRRKEATDSLAAAEEEIQIKRAEVNALEEVFEQFANRKQKISDQILEKSFQITAKEQEITQNRDKIEELTLEISQAETHVKLRHDETAEIHKTNQEHQNSIDAKELQNRELQEKMLEFKAKIDAINKERHESEQQLRSLQGDAKNTRESVYQLKTEHSRLESQKEKLETEAEQAISWLWEEYEMTYSEAETMKHDLGSQTEVNKQISSLRGQIKSLGNVNVDAIDELKNVSERYTFLTNQRDDLNKAKRDLIRIIEEMQTVMKKQFKEEFDKINKYFKTTFSELFGGGRADLSLEDETNVLECGIQINVQPPGKKLQSLSLLSGGERALSAIALLFAILRTKPTPFCFLDEIEAALDENNVYRYAEFIKRFSRNTQFILVTHRRGTMECADMIYGVTMQEKGVSKLLPLNLDEIAI